MNKLSTILIVVLNIGYRRHIDRQNYIPDTGYWVIYRDMVHYRTSNRTSYRMNIHVIAFINHMKLLEESLGS